MNTKLTLSIDQLTIAKAKKYAEKNDTSISKLVENYLKLLAQDVKHAIAEEPKARYSPMAKLRGSIKLPPGFDEKKERYEALWEKYLKLK